MLPDNPIYNTTMEILLLALHETFTRHFSPSFGLMLRPLVRFSGDTHNKLRKTFLKTHPLDSLLHAFGQIEQFRLHATETQAVQPDMEELQSAHVDVFNLAAIDAKKIFQARFQLM
jgi:hypothetical protein